MKTMQEKCELFLDLLPLEITHEFQDKYCPNQVYYVYSKKDPESFVKNVMEFSESHQDNSRFQALVRKHLGSPVVQEQSFVEKTESTAANQSILSAETPLNRIEPKELTSQQFKSKAVNYFSRKIPAYPCSEDELRRSIEDKLFSRPQNHDRYTRLTQEEKQFIVRYAGFSQRERDVFRLKSRRTYKNYRHIGMELSCSRSTIKQLAVRVDNRIRHMLDNWKSK